MWCFGQFSRSYKVTKFFFESDATPAFTTGFHIFVNRMEEKPSSKFYGVFDHFLQIYEVTKFQMIKLHLDVSDVMEQWPSGCMEQWPSG